MSTRTTVASIKIETEGITSGKLYLPVVLFLRIMVLKDVIKRVTAIPNIIFVFSSSVICFIVQECSPYARVPMRTANKNDGTWAGGAMLILLEDISFLQRS